MLILLFQGIIEGIFLFQKNVLNVIENSKSSILDVWADKNMNWCSYEYY